ncbi:MAG: hypothetical protein Kow0013_03110 [Pararhodobacter sp.]
MPTDVAFDTRFETPQVAAQTAQPGRALPAGAGLALAVVVGSLI